MAVSWTDEQKSAIEAPMKQGAILVSAAAGSGKTAVLVERILTKILNEETTIDRLLAVTFTNAAASEMREKIIKRMRREFKVSSGRKAEYIREQIRLALNADIMTIDSFCMRALQNNYYVLGIEPNFMIADTAEAELLKEDAAESLFNSLYCADKDSEESKRFNHLLNIYASNRNDEGLKELVKRIYKFIQSFAEPEKWLTEKAAMYTEDMQNSVWFKKYITELFIKPLGKRYYLQLDKLLSLAADNAGAVYTAGSVDCVKSEIAEAYGEITEVLINLVKAAYEISNAQTWTQAHDVYVSFIESGICEDGITLRRKPKDITVSLEEWKSICKARNDIKKAFFADCAVLAMTEAEAAEAMRGGRLKALADEVVWLVTEFDREYTKRKEIRNIKEFNDIEHLSYRLFCGYPDVCSRYRDKYDEILIDEYQDTNELQDSIFASISDDGKNLFMVGDLKQSIYRFRGGDPTIFKTKSAEYEGGDNLRIILSQNFRSRQEVLSAVNSVFEDVMTNELGDVNYEGKERIVREADKDVWEDTYKAEAVFGAYDVTEECNAELTKIRAEAEITADKIRSMLDEGFPVGDDLRPIKASDIAILARSTGGGVGEALTEALDKRGINSYVEVDDYFQKREISLMVSLISVIDNSLQDIPLTAVMRSPIGNFSDNELAKIRIKSFFGDMYSAVESYMESEDSEPLLAYKCRRFTDNLKRWRNYMKCKSVAELIWSIYEETGLYDFMGALEGGEEAQANLRLLYERAKQYESAGFKGLFNFIKYIEQVSDGRGDLSSANLVGEGHNVVKIMTMHKSKGLEFPAVFIFGTGRKMLRQTSEDKILLHKDLGFGLMYADADNRYFEKNLCYNLVMEKIQQEELSESLRILYVALTRAKNKLIVTAVDSFKPSESKSFDDLTAEQLDKWKSGISPANAKKYSDWIFPTALKEPAVWDFSVVKYKHSDGVVSDSDDEIPKTQFNEELREAVYKSLEYSYEYHKSGGIPTKISVSALKQLENERDYSERIDEYTPVYMDDQPAFMSSGKKGSEIGTAHHQIMAYIDLEKMRKAKNLYDAVSDEMQRIAQIGEIERFYVENENMRNEIAQHITGFFKSRLGAEMLNSEEVYRERAFQIMLGANRYDESLEERYSTENVILQGIIDCYYVYKGRITLLDYKTDRCRNENDVKRIADKYKIQLDLYSEAIEKITGSRADEKYLYLFDIGKEVKIGD